MDKCGCKSHTEVEIKGKKDWIKISKQKTK